MHIILQVVSLILETSMLVTDKHRLNLQFVLSFFLNVLCDMMSNILSKRCKKIYN